MNKRRFVIEGLAIWSVIIAIVGIPLILLTVKIPSLGLVIGLIILTGVFIGLSVWLTSKLMRVILNSLAKRQLRKPLPVHQISVITASLLIAFFMLIALGDNSYQYYEFLRVSTFVLSGLVAYLLYKNNKEGVMVWIFIATALLFNPFIPIHLNRDLWSFINLLAAVGLPASAIIAIKKEKL